MNTCGKQVPVSQGQDLDLASLLKQEYAAAL